MPNIPRSDALWSRATQVLAGGPGTLSKHPSRFPLGIAPRFVAYGDGAYVTDVDGNRYLDCSAALGPVLLGHNDWAVTKAVLDQAKRLASSSLSTPLEVEVAERLVACIPGAECVRFGVNGRDVTEAAVRVARYTTGHRHAIFIGYHGGHDSYLSTTDKCGGILEEIIPFNHQVPWGNWEALDKILETCEGDVACIMFEVPPTLLDVSASETTQTIQRYIDSAHDETVGACAIIDEVVTGFRYGLGGAQTYYGVTADMACFSKGMANGYPCAALTGPRDMLRVFEGGKVFLSQTFNAHPVALAAAQATMKELQKSAVVAALHTFGQMALDAVVSHIHKYDLPIQVRGNFARFVLDFGDTGQVTREELRTLWLQELCKAGILASVPYFPMCAWDMKAVQDFTRGLAQASLALHQVVHEQRPIGDALECPVITDVFSQRYNPLGARV